MACMKGERWGEASASREISYPKILELHVALSACVKLQCDFAIERTLLGVGEIHHGYAIEARPVTIADDFDEIVVPFAHAHHAFIFRRRPDDPASSVFPINTRRVVHHLAIDLELHALGGIDRSRLEAGVKEHTAVAIAHALEAHRELK